MLSMWFTSANDMSGEFECLVSAVNRDAFMMSPTHLKYYLLVTVTRIVWSEGGKITQRTILMWKKQFINHDIVFDVAL